MSVQPVGTFCLVLHSHLPWLAHAGAWPVGEEWLHQAWATSYLPVVGLLEELAAEGRRDVLTLGVTPVLAAMLDDPYCLAEFHAWLGFWATRAEGAYVRGVGVAAEEATRAAASMRAFESGWRSGGSPRLRRLADAGVVELLGGPAAHPFQPLLPQRMRAAQLAVGLDDAALRFGRRPEGIWAPECAYAPGLERGYAAAGVRRFLVDGPNLLGAPAVRADPRLAHGATAAAWTVAGSDVVAFARDLEVTYRVWSPRSGYPGGRWYRDFHTFDHPSGLRPARVTSKRTPPEHKAPYDAARAAAAVARDAADFVTMLRRRLLDLRAARDGRPGLVVAAYDSELFGHWWHEGPAFLGQVLRALPEAGVRVTTLRGAVEHGHVEGDVELPRGSWGAGKDWHVWDSPAVADLVALNAESCRRLLDLVDKAWPADAGWPERSAALDQATRETFLATSSDWAFMVTGDSAADYARGRARAHAQRLARLAALLESGEQARAAALAADLRRVDGPFGHLDARVLARTRR